MPSRTVSTSIETLVNENRLRKSVLFQNEDASINVFIKQEEPGQATVSSTNHDHRLGPGGSLALNWETDGKEAIQGRWTVISASGTPLLSFFETEDVVR